MTGRRGDEAGEREPLRARFGEADAELVGDELVECAPAAALRICHLVGTGASISVDSPASVDSPDSSD